MFEGFIVIIYLGFAVSAISVTLTKADIAQPLRTWVTAKFGENTFLNCPFCTSYWIMFPLILMYRPRVVELTPVVDILISGFAIVGVASIISGAIIQMIPNLKEKK